MKKLFLTTFILSILAVSVNAQYLGIKGGLNLSNLHLDNVDSENMRVGYHFGAYFNLPISDAFAFQPEVLYSTKGSKAEYDYDFGIFGNIKGNTQIKLDYIDIPLLGVFRVGDNFELHVGPYVGFLANSSYKFEGTVDSGGDKDLDSDSFKNLDYGLVGGFAINIQALQIGARYNYGLQKVQDSDMAKALIGDAKNSYIQVFAAIRIGNYD